MKRGLFRGRLSIKEVVLGKMVAEVLGSVSEKEKKRRETDGEEIGIPKNREAAA